MKTNRGTAILLALMALSSFTICRADEEAKPIPVDPPADAELRVVISKGLGFLAAEGGEWMSAKKCNSCHHIPELLWSHREAEQRGLAVDPKKFDEWLQWAVERAAEKKPGSEVAKRADR